MQNSPWINPVNCWKPLRAEDATTWLVTAGVNAKKSSDWAISNQVSLKKEEGSTTKESIRSGEIHTSAGLFASLSFPVSFIHQVFMKSPYMVLFCGQFQILNPIVSLVSVFMMRNLVGQKESSKMFFHHKAMNRDVSLAVSERMSGFFNLDIAMRVNEADVIFIWSKNVLLLGYLADISGSESQFFSDLDGRKSFPGHVSNLLNGGDSISSGDSEKLHAVQNILLTYSVLYGYLLQGLLLILCVQAFFAKRNLNFSGHGAIVSPKFRIVKQKRRYSLFLSERKGDRIKSLSFQ